MSVSFQAPAFRPSGRGSWRSETASLYHRESRVGYSDIKADGGLDNAELAEVYAIVVTL